MIRGFRFKGAFAFEREENHGWTRMNTDEDGGETHWITAGENPDRVSFSSIPFKFQKLREPQSSEAQMAELDFSILRQLDADEHG